MEGTDRPGTKTEIIIVTINVKVNSEDDTFVDKMTLVSPSHSLCFPQSDVLDTEFLWDLGIEFVNLLMVVRAGLTIAALCESCVRPRTSLHTIDCTFCWSTGVRASFFFKKNGVLRT